MTIANPFTALVLALCGPAAVPLQEPLPPAVGVSLASSPEADRGVPRVTLELVDSDVRSALQLVSRQCGVNIVAGHDVAGTISLSLDGATLEETLAALAQVGGFEVEREGNIVTVQTLEGLVRREEQRRALEPVPLPEDPPVFAPTPLVLRLRYVDAERVLGIVEGMLSPDGKVSLLKTADHLAQERANLLALGGPQNGVLNGAANQATGDLQIGAPLSSSSVGQPASAHTLVVYDEQARLDQIEEVVRSVDVKPLQVVIETRFVEISLGNDQRLGIDWNVVASMNGAAAPHTGPFGSSSLGSLDPNDVSGSPGLFPPAPDSVSTPGSAGLFTFGTLDFTQFSGLLELIQRESDVQMVSNPRIVVGDRHTATILVGERYPILSANISEFGTVTEQLDRYEPIGVQLAVTPSVLDDDVELLVRPSTSTLGPIVEGSTGLSVARINSRQIDTQVRVRNGQTVVVGGLITSRESEVESRVPLLGSLPLLGRLFRHTATSTERVDLVVFLTVTILEENGLNAEQRRLFEETGLAGELMLQPAEQRTPLEYRPSEPLY